MSLEPLLECYLAGDELYIANTFQNFEDVAFLLLVFSAATGKPTLD